MYKIRKNSIPRIILEYLGEVSFLTLDALFPKQYAFAAISRPLFGLDTKKSISKNTLSVALARLKKEKLVIQSIEGWKITKKGGQKLAQLKKTIIPKEDGICRLVIFDIPEKQRVKRDRLRFELTAHGFTLLQKSVWRGYSPLSEEFIELIDSLNLQDKVHIFSIQQYGTLKKE